MQDRSTQTRNRILQVSLRLFGERGYNATGVARICKASQVSKGAFYHHFRSKQALFLQLMQGWLSGVDGQLQRALAGSRSVPSGLLAMASEMRPVFQAADGRLEIFLEFWQQARRDKAVWKGIMAPYRRYRDLLAEIVRQGIAEGSFRSVDANAAGQALETLAVGTLLQGVLDPRGARWDRVIRSSVRLLIEGLAGQRSGSAAAAGPGRAARR
ncbi:MAG TPA: TetR/AcrR family transcriptional regulator [Spirochaetia bacterium]|nr:TetR/AcrR family transcriptional regulator [Spirochaetia bacterium]